MKQFKITAFLFAAVVLSLTACLKKGEMTTDPDNSPSVIEFANTGSNVSGSTSTYPRFNTDLGSVKTGQSVKFNINVNYAGAKTAPEDITVNLSLDPTLLAKFNTENGTNYVAPPTAIYTFPSTATIKKGERMATVEVVVTNNASFDFGVNYALPIQISSVSSGKVSANFGKAVYSFSVRNTLDGVYLMEATSPMVDLSVPTITGWYPVKMHLITYTGNSIALYDGVPIYTSVYGHPIKNSGTGSYYGSFSPVFFFDATGKITSITNYYGQESSANKRSAVLDPTGVNQATFNADGSIKSFEVSYIMTQSTAAVPFGPRTYFKEKFTYIEPR